MVDRIDDLPIELPGDIGDVVARRIRPEEMDNQGGQSDGSEHKGSQRAAQTGLKPLFRAIGRWSLRTRGRITGHFKSRSRQLDAFYCVDFLPPARARVRSSGPGIPRIFSITD
jgi:hypothetical protein